MTEVVCNYKENISFQIAERNKIYGKFAAIIQTCEKLREEKRRVNEENEKLQREVRNLKEENENISTKIQNNPGPQSSDRTEQVLMMEQKLISAQEELVEIQRTKGSRIQQIADLNIALREYGQEIKTLTDNFADSKTKAEELAKRKTELEEELHDEKQAKQTIQDEYQALLLASSVTDDKLRKLQDEHRELVDRFIRYKNSDADHLNSENDTFKRTKDERTSAALQDAIDEVPAVSGTAVTANKPVTNNQRTTTTTKCPQSPENSPQLNFLQRKFHDLFNRKADDDQATGTQPMMTSRQTYALHDFIPQEAACKWRAHNSEVTSTRFTSTGILATGGFDKLINIWNFVADQARLQSTLRGSNGGITSIDIDPEEQLLSASSNDCAARIWHLTTQRLKLTLTGHGGKVLSARFLGSSYRLATGSQDRTVKVWDIRSGACLQTFMAGSSCNDVIAADGVIVSGHFDKKIRVWDARCGRNVINEISVGGRVTSLDVPLDVTTSLVCCTKDHSLEIVDLRKSQVRHVFSDDNFKVATDQTRCSFSPNGKYVAVGSTDGSVLSWDVETQKRVSCEQIHTEPVISSNWKSGRLVTGDKNKTCVIWTSSSITS